MVQDEALRRVVLCADDFGISDGVSRAIAELGAQGRISATSAMANCPAFARNVPRLKEVGKRIGVGLHLTLTAGAPLGPMPRFAPAGRLPAFGAVLQAALSRRLPAAEIAAEIGRQLDVFERAWGAPPDFVDGHQHVHVLPGVRGALLRALRQRGWTAIWLRDPSDEIAAIVARGVGGAKALAVATLAVGFRAAASKAGLDANEGFSGFSPFDPALDPGRVFRPAFRRLGPRPVVMCHPGYVDDELRALDPVLETREQERAYLASEDFSQLLERRRVRLASSLPPP